MSNYNTIQGDTWDLIAFKAYGVHGYVSNVIEANPQYINTAIFGANISLTIPDITVEQQIAASAPPWKR